MSCYNIAIGGSHMTYFWRYTPGISLICGPEGTKYNITQDYIFVAHGTNDWNSNVPIGTINDNPEEYSDATTFYGALNLALL